MPHKHAVDLLVLIIAGVIGGAHCGLIFVPLIVAAMISGVASLGDVRKLGRLGGITVLYFLLTTGFAVLLGLLLVNLIQPGVGLALQGGVVPERVQGKQDSGLTDILL